MSDSKHRPRVLVIDIGGSGVKFGVPESDRNGSFPSGPSLTAQQMVDGVKAHTEGWHFDVVTVGIPAPVVHDRLIQEPHNLGSGWMGFDFAAAFGKPTKLVNDAAMQALGDYKGGRMLFLGLGTGLGSAMIVDGLLEPLELAHLPYKKGRTFEDYVGIRGLKRLGKKKWRTAVNDVIVRLKAALQVDYVVVGGGNAARLKQLPPDTRVCPNTNALLGGYRLWDDSYRRETSSVRSVTKDTE